LYFYQAYDIVLAGRSLTKVHAAIDRAVAEFPQTSSKLSVVQIDIELDQWIKKAFDETQAKFGRLDVLVNNAGKQTSHGPYTLLEG
jgi:NAD(P)-dependent dehydrogenase (short-subunit alcohol dehydrogenase family)